MAVAQKSAWAALLVLLLSAAGAQLAAAHGGSIHAWDFETPGYNFTHVVAANCTGFQTYNPALNNSYIPGALPFFPQTNSSLNLTAFGVVQLVVYVDPASCAVTSALQPYLLVTYTNSTDNETYAYSYEKIYGYAMQGTCEAGVQDLYRNNATLGDSRGNLLWFREGETDGNGTLWGSAPNVFVPRWPGSAPNGLQSFLLYPNPSDSYPLCCNFSYGVTPDYVANVTSAAVEECQAALNQDTGYLGAYTGAYTGDNGVVNGTEDGGDADGDGDDRRRSSRRFLF